jgi:hypothetical protein
LKYRSHKRILETHRRRHNGDPALQIIIEVVDKDSPGEATIDTILDPPYLSGMNMAGYCGDVMITGLEDHLRRVHTVVVTSMFRLEAGIRTIDVTGAVVAHDLHTDSEMLGTVKDLRAQDGAKMRMQSFRYLEETLGISQTFKSSSWTSWTVHS